MNISYNKLYDSEDDFIAYINHSYPKSNLGIIWFSGLNSDMNGTKASKLSSYTQKNKINSLFVIEDFKNEIKKVSSISSIYNYYGMVEQTGSIFLECSEGYFHCSIFSDIFIRRNDFSICDFNEIGLVQLISLLPKSYPGHNIISEDLGEIIGIDDCKCGRLGKYFVIHGRAEKAEIRGCSDTYE